MSRAGPWRHCPSTKVRTAERVGLVRGDVDPATRPAPGPPRPPPPLRPPRPRRARSSPRGVGYNPWEAKGVGIAPYLCMVASSRSWRGPGRRRHQRKVKLSASIRAMRRLKPRPVRRVHTLEQTQTLPFQGTHNAFTANMATTTLADRSQARCGGEPPSAATATHHRSSPAVASTYTESAAALLNH